MPCRDECHICNQFPCVCARVYPRSKSNPSFDVEGALCDVLALLEEKHVATFYEIDERIHDWWRAHEKKEGERIKKEALAKLSAREKRALGLK